MSCNDYIEHNASSRGRKRPAPLEFAESLRKPAADLNKGDICGRIRRGLQAHGIHVAPLLASTRNATF
jgi:hypothetical protein